MNKADTKSKKKKTTPKKKKKRKKKEKKKDSGENNKQLDYETKSWWKMTLVLSYAYDGKCRQIVK